MACLVLIHEITYYHNVFSCVIICLIIIIVLYLHLCRDLLVFCSCF